MAEADFILMLLLLGRIYTSLSFALPLATLVVSAIWITRFKENGPQSAGLGPLMVGALTVLGALAANAILAGLLAWFQPACRTSLMVVVLLVIGLLVTAALFWWLVNRPGRSRRPGGGEGEIHLLSLLPNAEPH